MLLHASAMPKVQRGGTRSPALAARQPAEAGRHRGLWHGETGRGAPAWGPRGGTAGSAAAARQLSQHVLGLCHPAHAVCGARAPACCRQGKEGSMLVTPEWLARTHQPRPAGCLQLVPPAQRLPQGPSDCCWALLAPSLPQPWRLGAAWSPPSCAPLCLRQRLSCPLLKTGPWKMGRAAAQQEFRQGGRPSRHLRPTSLHHPTQGASSTFLLLPLINPLSKAWDALRCAG